MNWLCLPTDFNYTTEQLGDLTKEGIADELYKRGMDILTAKEKRYGAKTMRELERICKGAGDGIRRMAVTVDHDLTAAGAALLP